MVVSFVFLFLIVLGCSGMLFFFFGFFVPAIRLRYDGIDELLSAEEYLNDDSIESTAARNDRLSGRTFRGYARIDSGTGEVPDVRLSYNGDRSCSLFFSVYGSQYMGENRCIGFGDCQRICAQNAISIVDGVAVVNSACDGCGKCIDACPVSLISFCEMRPSVENRGFKFWKSCYKLFSAKNRI